MKNPIKYSLKTEVWPLLIFLATVGLSFWVYPQLPEKVISHWDFNGKANGWTSREFYAIFFPALLAVIYALFRVLPKFDPNSDRYKEFAGAYLAIRNSILLVLFIVFAAASFANLGYIVNICEIVAGAIGFIMIVLSNYFKKLKRNWFVGIRTPWTMSSENVWNKTHLLGSKLFIFLGLSFILIPWLAPVIGFLILFVEAIILMPWIVIYSYVLYKNEKEK
ncbi:MAG: SdpI family protein [bacterium]|nr:SdpI family protein [bacterium]